MTNNYIVFLNIVVIDDTKFWDGVSFAISHDDDTYSDYFEYNEERYYLDDIDKGSYIISDRPQREINVSMYEYQSISRNDKTKEYFEPVKKALGIDMKDNYAPQFRDGVNPLKDGKGKGRVLPFQGEGLL